MNKTILVVEDDPQIADLIRKYLEAEQFTYHRAHSGAEAISLFDRIAPDLVVLDILLPQMDGGSVCEKIRAISDVPIIMVTGLSDDEHRLEGFARGADDYLCKPFNPRELIARIKAILRRHSLEFSKVNTISCGALSVNLDERLVTVNGGVVELTQIEFDMLCMLISDPRKVFSREKLLDGSHKIFTESYARSVDFHIKNLRRKINVTNNLNYIKAVYGVGYKLV